MAPIMTVTSADKIAIELHASNADSDRPMMKAATQSQPKWWQNAIVRNSLKIGCLICTWYVLSTSLGLYNKYLVGKKHGLYKRPFPAPLLMSAIQFAFQNVLAKIVLGCGLIKRTIKDTMTWPEYFRTVVANGVTTGLDIGLSNLSLVFITMSFYTMCKATVPIFLLIFSFVMGIEKPSFQLASVVAVMTVGLLLLVKGEEEFDGLGFALVMLASCFSGLRWSLTQLLLHGRQGSHHVAYGNPLEVLEALTPVMAISAGLLSLCTERLWVTLPASPYFASPLHMLMTAGIIAAGALIAFLMVWTEFKVIAETSSLTLMIAGTCKEVVTVVAAVIIMGDPFGPVNVLGLIVVISGVMLFNYYKYRRVKAGELRINKVPRSSHGGDAPGSRRGSAAGATGTPGGGVNDAESPNRQPDSPVSPSMLRALEFEPLLPSSGVMIHRM